jgi:hypothetical protein
VNDFQRTADAIMGVDSSNNNEAPSVSRVSERGGAACRPEPWLSWPPQGFF